MKSKAVSAASYAVFAPESQEFIMEHNADEPLPMASTTKIMTALLCAEYIEKHGNKEVSVTSEMVMVEGSALGLREGDKISLLSLMAGMLLASGNDAANTVAFFLGGDLESFALMMNKKAKELGMKNTSFVTPSGLDSEGHFSTARDMALLSAKAMENQLFGKIAGSDYLSISYFAKEKESKITVNLKNHNKLLNMLDDCVGIKTGYTQKSGRCLVSAINKDDNLLIAVTLNAPDDWNDHIALFSEALNKRKCYSVKYKNFTVFTANGTKAHLKLENDNAVYYYGSNEVTEKIYLPRFIYNEGSGIYGRVDYILNGKIIDSKNIGL